MEVFKDSILGLQELLDGGGERGISDIKGAWPVELEGWAVAGWCEGMVWGVNRDQEPGLDVLGLRW